MIRNTLIALTALAVLASGVAFCAPPLLEVSAARPLFVFAAPDRGMLTTSEYATLLQENWSTLPKNLRSLGAYSFDVTGPDADLAGTGLLLRALGGSGISASLTVADSAGARSIEAVNELMTANANVVAIHVAGMRFESLAPYGGLAASGLPPAMRWLDRVLDLASAHGRLVSVELDTISWLRVLSDPALRPVYDSLKSHAPYAIPIHPMEHPYTLTATSALIGLWLEGAGGHWGVRLSTDWYESTGFVRPGVFGPREAGSHMPPSLYRATIFAGAMGGATVYRFEDNEDLWFGARSYQWAETIAPTLSELVTLGAIPRKALVAKAARIAYQFDAAESGPRAFASDIDAALGQGRLQRQAYGVANPRVEGDLFPNRGTNYLVPLLSSRAGPELLSQFPSLLRPGYFEGAPDWSAAGSEESAPSAAIFRVGRSVFVMHSGENRFERQSYRVPEMPAPVRDIRVQRNPEGIQLTWPFRENDFAYTVYRRVLPDIHFEAIASGLDIRRYVDRDVAVDETVAYTLTALTNEQEPLEGTLNWGEYKVFSTAAGRIEEEVVVYPETEIAISAPVTVIGRGYPDRQSLWPAIEGMSEGDMLPALAVSERIGAFRAAVASEDIEQVEALFAADYLGADGSNAVFARRYLRAFLERHEACRLFVQAQSWAVEPGAARVSVTLFVQLSGVDWSAGLPRISSFPAREASVVTLDFEQRDGDWRVVSSDPAFPSLAEIGR